MSNLRQLDPDTPEGQAALEEGRRILEEDETRDILDEIAREEAGE